MGVGGRYIFFGREAAPALVLHVLAKAFTREKPSAPRRRPPPPAGPKPKVLVVDSEVRGTTLQKLIVVGEVREYDSSKLIVKWKLKWKWSEWVSEVKWCLFWSLNFFIFRYVEGGVLGNNYISIKKCTTTFLWVLNFGQVGEIFKNFQNHTTTVTFFKNGLQLVIFWKK